MVVLIGVWALRISGLISNWAYAIVSIAALALTPIVARLLLKWAPERTTVVVPAEGVHTPSAMTELMPPAGSPVALSGEVRTDGPA